MSLVIYRKYRPKSFEEVIGQEKIIKILTQAISMDRIAHAYLFTGPRGTGKTTIARIFAKAINCTDRKNGEPCNKCTNCTTINEGKTFDIVEIDAASNTGVDNIRELKTTIGFSPSQLKYKVFIIDEAHMLSKGAFNALLKTLEEPPPHAIFILATTEIHKIPATIISRSQRFDFHKLKLDEMIKRLGEIVKSENIKVEKGVLEMIASSSDGGMRDAESLLGQIISLAAGDKTIEIGEVKTILGLADTESVLNMIGYLSRNEVKEAIVYLDELSYGGQDLEQFAESLIEALRKMLLIKTNPDLKKHILEDSTEEQLEKISSLAGSFSEQELLWLVKRFITTKLEIKSAVISQLPIELAVIEYDLLKKKGKGAEGKKPENNESEKPITGGGKRVTPPSDPNASYNPRYVGAETTVEGGGEYEAEEEKAAPKEKVKEKKREEKDKKTRDSEAATVNVSLDDIKAAWNSILRTAKSYNHSISAFLKLAVPQEVSGDTLVIATPYKFHSEKLSETINRSVIEKVLAEVIPASVGIRVKVIQDEKVTITKAPAGEKKEADPSVESALDVFGGVVE